MPKPETPKGWHIPDCLVLGFFLRFSRFEYALKKNGFLSNLSPGSRAKPNWNSYVKKFESEFTSTPDAQRLLELKPLRQMVGNDASLEFAELAEDECASPNDLGRVVNHLCVVRNNLFHGGKNGPSDIQDQKRNCELLETCIRVMDALPKGCLEDDYLSQY